MDQLQKMGDAALLILYRAVVNQLGQTHEVSQKIHAEIKRRGLIIPVVH